jgi:hypothetical protein
MTNSARMRVLALVPAIERHVGHWAASSPSIDLRRVIIEENDAKDQTLEAVLEHRPHVLAVLGKRAREYLDLLDDLTARLPFLADVPRVYKCQNTHLTSRIGGRRPTKNLLCELSQWVRSASDPRIDLVMVQSLDDVGILVDALAPTKTIYCPFGYDEAVFSPQLPELPRTTDVGCFFNLRNEPARESLVAGAREICQSRGWAFRFEQGVYWHGYAHNIRTTKICLHRSVFHEIPYRMVETMVLGSLFLTDPLEYGVETLFSRGDEYLEYSRDMTDLERILQDLLENDNRRLGIAEAGRRRAIQYSWPLVAEKYVAPALRELVTTRFA